MRQTCWTSLEGAALLRGPRWRRPPWGRRSLGRPSGRTPRPGAVTGPPRVLWPASAWCGRRRWRRGCVGTPWSVRRCVAAPVLRHCVAAPDGPSALGERGVAAETKRSGATPGGACRQVERPWLPRSSSRQSVVRTSVDADAESVLSERDAEVPRRGMSTAWRAGARGGPRRRARVVRFVTLGASGFAGPCVLTSLALLPGAGLSCGCKAANCCPGVPP